MKITNKGRNDNLILSLPPKRQQLVWEKIQVKGPDECWPWVRCLNAYGYGRIIIHGKQLIASRVVKLLSSGPPPKQYYEAMHLCDFKRCCNPKHLKWGTPHENMQDLADKGRNGRHTKPECTARGERSGRAKID